MAIYVTISYKIKHLYLLRLESFKSSLKSISGNCIHLGM